VILISGSTGFLGAHMACYLLLHHKKIRLIRRESASLADFEKIFNYYFNHFSNDVKNTLFQSINWVEADILAVPELAEAFLGITEVYHCAAMVSFVQADKEKMEKTNVEGTANMVNLALANGIEKFCYISTIAAIGRSLNGATIDENCKWENTKLNSNYAISKYKAEMEVWRAKEEGLNVCIVNPGVILGYGNFTKGSIVLFNSIYKGMPFYTNGINGYIDVQDITKICLQLMEQNIFGQRYILVSQSISIKDLFYNMAKYLNVKPPKTLITPILSEIAWRLFSVVRFFKLSSFSLTKETARASQKQYFYNNGKIIKVLNFEFKTVERTIKEVCSQFLIDEKE
jgi:nucleoside-diphosphate-sugar epimerase